MPIAVRTPIAAACAAADRLAKPRRTVFRAIFDDAAIVPKVIGIRAIAATICSMRIPTATAITVKMWIIRCETSEILSVNSLTVSPIFAAMLATNSPRPVSVVNAIAKPCKAEINFKNESTTEPSNALAKSAAAPSAASNT